MSSLTSLGNASVLGLALKIVGANVSLDPIVERMRYSMGEAGAIVLMAIIEINKEFAYGNLFALKTNLLTRWISALVFPDVIEITSGNVHLCLLALRTRYQPASPGNVYVLKVLLKLQVLVSRNAKIMHTLMAQSVYVNLAIWGLNRGNSASLCLNVWSPIRLSLVTFACANQAINVWASTAKK